MKFKTKEEVMLDQDGYESFGTGVEKAFKSFSERVEFYKKWKKEMVEKLSIKMFALYINWIMKNAFDEEIKDKSAIEIQQYIYCNGIDKDWLFDYCFGDI